MANPASPITTEKNEIGKNCSRECRAGAWASTADSGIVDDMAPTRQSCVSGLSVKR